MASFTITDLVVGNQTMSGFDIGIVTTTGVLTANSGRAVDATNSGTQTLKLDLYGILRTSGNGSAATKGIEFDGAEMQVVVGKSGVITANGTSGIGVDAGFDERFGFTTHGTIDTDGKAFVFDQLDTSSDLEFINTGTITSRDVLMDFTRLLDDASVLNSGTMISEEVMIDFDNAGLTSTFDLTNTGEMISGANGIDLTSMRGFADISNAGFISGIDAIANSTSASFSNSTLLVNSGTIQGEVNAYEGSFGLDEIVNSGLMVGDIRLAGADDLYQGKNGRVNGEVYGDDGNDMLIGGSEDNYLDGGSDEDDLRGNGGNDELFGGDADDTLSGAEGRDQLFGGAGRDNMRGGSGDDKIDGSSGNDNMWGKSDDDELIGGGGADDLFGGRGDDDLVGGAQSDELMGGRGDDTLDGSDGTDVLNGGKGDDDLTGGGKADTFVFGRNAGEDIIRDFQNGQDQIDLTAYGLDTSDYGSVVAAALSNAGGGATFLDLTEMGGDGSVLIEGLSFGSANASDFIL